MRNHLFAADTGVGEFIHRLGLGVTFFAHGREKNEGRLPSLHLTLETGVETLVSPPVRG